jgi:PEP-CTERM motif
MNKFTIALAAAASTLAISTTASAAIVLQTSNFIASPTSFNGFEAIESNPNYTAPHFFSGTATYSEGGIDVKYVGGSGSATEIWTKYQRVGTNGWYNDGGGNGYTRVTRTGGGDIDAIQFLAGTGFSSSTLLYELRKAGSVVATGVAGPVSGGLGNTGLRYYGFSGGGFDEVRLQSNFNNVFNPTAFEAFAVDDIALSVSAVPEPAAWAMMLAGFGLAGAAMRRRRTAMNVTYA